MNTNIYYPEILDLQKYDSKNIEEIVVGACNRVGYNIRDIFPTTYLYIKQHSVTGKLYFGKTMQDVQTYPGSGVYWTRHVNKYGKDLVNTIWFAEFSNPYDIVRYALAFSELNNIADSKEWANLMSENGLDGGFAGCAHYKNTITGEIRMFHNAVTIPAGYEKFSFTKNSKWYTNELTGETIRSLTHPGDGWKNSNGNLRNTNKYIDKNGIIHQVHESKKQDEWELYSHSLGKRLYSDGTTVTLFEHDKQPPGWEIYDEKFGKRMYKLLDGSKKWFKEGEEPEGAIYYVSSKGCRQYINRDTNHVIQVPHGTQPEGYVEYSFAHDHRLFINKETFEIKKLNRHHVDLSVWFFIPTFYKSPKGLTVLCINTKTNEKKYLREDTEDWICYHKELETKCEISIKDLKIIYKN